MEKTYVMLKPDCIERKLIWSVIKRIEEKGLEIRALKMLNLTDEILNKHYEEHLDKPFYPSLKEYVQRGPVVALVVEGEDAVSKIRKMNGATNPKDAEIGSVRGDFGISMTENFIHSSDSVESGAREIGIFFAPEELV